MGGVPRGISQVCCLPSRPMYCLAWSTLLNVAFTMTHCLVIVESTATAYRCSVFICISS
jgi:hypothetical protein